VVLGLYLAVIGGCFCTLVILERTGWRLRHQAPANSWLPTRLPMLMRQNDSLRSALLLLVALPVPLFIAGAALWSSEVPRDFGFGAAVIGIAFGALLLFGNRVPGLAARAAVYVAAAFSTYLFVRYPGSAASVAFAMTNGGMVLLAAALLLYIRFIGQQRFELTPTDYLIAFTSLALALFVRFGGGEFGADRLLQFVLYVVVLFYACEVAISNVARWRYVLGVPVTLAFAIMAIRGISLVM
jgi:hypothetical protein